MDACTSSLYNTNSFRVLGVSVTATPRQIKRRMDDLKIAAEMDDLEEEYSFAFPLSPLPDMDDLRRAVKRLQDPQTRFVDEFFWFWPLNWDECSTDKALQALANGDPSVAETFWTERLAGCTESEWLVVIHNLAVLYHMLAIDMEHDCHKNETQLLMEKLDLLNRLWRKSFDWWEKLADHEGFWDLLRERVLAIDDPSLSSGFIHRFRSVFPIAFDNINADFAAVHSKTGNHTRASLHIQFMKETHEGLDNISASLSKVTRPLHARIDAALTRATENLRDDPNAGANRARRLLAETAEPLKALSALLGSDHAEVRETQDEIVEAGCNCAIAYGNETRCWSVCMLILEDLIQLASSDKLLDRLQANMCILKENLAHQNSSSPPKVPSQYRKEFAGGPTFKRSSKPPKVPPQYRKEFAGGSTPKSPSSSQKAPPQDEKVFSEEPPSPSSSKKRDYLLYAALVAFFLFILYLIIRISFPSVGSFKPLTSSSFSNAKYYTINTQFVHHQARGF
jgi:hypothetical protein